MSSHDHIIFCLDLRSTSAVHLGIKMMASVPCIVKQFRLCRTLKLNTDLVRSVLIHALPGMALLAHRYCPVPPTVLAILDRFSPAAATWAGARTAIVEGSRAASESSLWWTAAAPMAFYAAWQLVYWLLVQVLTGCSLARQLLPGR